MTLLATLVWTPIGVYIGFRPKLARFMQPLCQIAASFPVNLTFPFVVGIFIAYNIDMDWGCILLIALGTQWYILFNVIACAMAVPSYMKEVANNFGLTSAQRWKKLILPAIFPYWVTGACTAAGGAWNASIVAELATWGKHSLRAQGLGSYIAEVTRDGQTAKIVASVGVMSLFVVLINKLVWRKLYALASQKYKIEN